MIRLFLFSIYFLSSLISVSQTLIPMELEGQWILEKAVLEERSLSEPDKISQMVLLPKQTNDHFMFRSCILELNIFDPLDSPELSLIVVYPKAEMINPILRFQGGAVSFMEFSQEPTDENEFRDSHLTYTYHLEAPNNLTLSTREVFYNSPLQVPLKAQLHIYLIRK